MTDVKTETPEYPIGPEHPADIEAIAALHTAAFDDAKVVSLVATLRGAPAALAPVSLVARDRHGRIVGHLMLSAARLDAPARLVDVLMLSPLAVHPDTQRRGIGTRLIRRALEEARSRMVPLVFVEGDPAYYARHGFERASPLGFRAPSLRIPDAAFQVARMPCHAEWMTGSLVYSEIFWALDCVGLRPDEAD